jgi:hypothetical protein
MRKPMTAAEVLADGQRLRQYRDKTQIKAMRERVASLEREVDALSKALGVFDDLKTSPKVKPITRRERTSGLREATPMLLNSDWHVGETVRPDSVNGMNRYNPTICRARAAKLNEAIAWEIALERNAFKIRDCIIWLGGDLITGYIHDELVEGNSMSPTQEVLFAQELCEAQINHVLSLGMERVVVVCNFGNHGRTTIKKRVATGAFNSFEFLCYQSLKLRFAADKRVEFVIAEGNMSYLKVYDTIIRTTHGDAINYGGGIGGITVPVLRKVAQWNKGKHADETVFGHFHTRLTLRGVNGNGSLIGYSPFSQFIGAEPEDPAQGMFLIDARRGKVHPKDLFVSDSKDRI